LLVRSAPINIGLHPHRKRTSLLRQRCEFLHQGCATVAQKRRLADTRNASGDEDFYRRRFGLLRTGLPSLHELLQVRYAVVAPHVGKLLRNAVLIEST
jgi:hypothetical protein